MPLWARAAAAVLAVGMAAGAANLNVRYDGNGLSVRTGWLPAPAAAPDATPWRADLAALEARVQVSRPEAATIVPAADRARPSEADAEMLRRVRAMIAQSEKKEENELALQIAGLTQGVQAQRIADLTAIETYMRSVSNSAGIELRQQRQAINSMALRVNQTR